MPKVVLLSRVEAEERIEATVGRRVSPIAESQMPPVQKKSQAAFSLNSTVSTVKYCCPVE